MSDTIYALSSGALPSGVAIIRISGENCQSVLASMCRKPFPWAERFLDTLFKPNSDEIIDHVLVLNFDHPHSFTGEDVVEFHVHGGFGVVQAVFDSFSLFEGFRHAEPGEFTLRAFQNGKLDLTQVEGLADLIQCETEAQRSLAVAHSGGKLRAILENYSARLLRIRSFIEAEIDFVEEDDIPQDVSDEVWVSVEVLLDEVASLLSGSRHGELIRSGFSVALLGAPNSGKSTLLNALAKRDVAIVSDVEGTTRDVIEVKLDIEGYVVRMLDTAGIRDSSDDIEIEGIRRSQIAAKDSDLTIWLLGDKVEMNISKTVPDIDVYIQTKSDLGLPEFFEDIIQISAKTGHGLDDLLLYIRDHILNCTVSGNDQILSRQRQISLLQEVYDNLCSSLKVAPMEIRAEYLRSAAQALARTTGSLDVEDLLGDIFSQFCVGK